MKNILVAVDFSKSNLLAVHFAAQLAQKMHYKMILMHAYKVNLMSPDVPLGLIAEQAYAVEKDAEKKIKLLCEEIKNKHKIACTCKLLEGDPAEEILKFISKRKSDLCVLQNKEKNNLKNRLFGTIASKITYHSVIPTLSLPHKHFTIEIKKIAFVTDYTLIDLKSLKKLVELAKFFDSKIILIHLAEIEYSEYTEEERIQYFITKVVKHCGYKNISIQLLHGDDHIKILKGYIENEQVDLLCLSGKHQNIFQNLFNKSMDQKLILDAEIPLLVYPNN